MAIIFRDRGFCTHKTVPDLHGCGKHVYVSDFAGPRKAAEGIQRQLRMIKAKRSAYGENGSGCLLNVTGRPFFAPRTGERKKVITWS